MMSSWLCLPNPKGLVPFTSSVALQSVILGCRVRDLSNFVYPWEEAQRKTYLILDRQATSRLPVVHVSSKVVALIFASS
jgi:hypothetical protein